MQGPTLPVTAAIYYDRIGLKRIMDLGLMDLILLEGFKNERLMSWRILRIDGFSATGALRQYVGRHLKLFEY